MNAIEVDGLTKRYSARVKEPGLAAAFKALVRPQYRDVLAVDNISFTVPKGQILAFIGPNGAGKSTTIKMMTGILHPTSGRASVMGYDPQKQRAQLSYSIGAMFGQKSQLMMHLPAADSMRLLGAVYDVDKRVCESRIAELAGRFGIEDLMSTPLRKLSLGQRIRCELAASLLHQPSILFLDEPTIGLDVVVKAAIRDLITELNREQGTTVFLTSHDVGDIEALCQRAIVIDSGRIVLDKPIGELRAGYLNIKRVSVRYDGAPPLIERGGMRAVAAEDGKAVYEVDTAVMPIGDAARLLVERGGIADLTVEDPPMEGIIRAIFAGKKGVEEQAAGNV